MLQSVHSLPWTMSSASQSWMMTIQSLWTTNFKTWLMSRSWPGYRRRVCRLLDNYPLHYISIWEYLLIWIKSLTGQDIQYSELCVHVFRSASGVRHYLGHWCPPELQLLCALRIAAPREDRCEDGGWWWGFWWPAASPTTTFPYRVNAAECVTLTQLVQSQRATPLQLIQHTVPQQPLSQHSQLLKHWNTGLPHQHRSAVCAIIAFRKLFCSTE